MGKLNEAIEKSGKVEKTRPCIDCKEHPGLNYFKDKPCYTCKGKLIVDIPDFDKILEDIKGRKGLRSKRPADARAYYVWRLARFHGGVDVTMPMMASVELGADPYKKELDSLSDTVAKSVFGTDMAAAYRWGSALGFAPTAPAGLPSTAYPCGPAATAEKPIGERAEMDAPPAGSEEFHIPPTPSDPNANDNLPF